jgi:DNA-binding MarR family transcriptional regulator
VLLELIYPGFILECLKDFEGKTQYKAVKEISRRHGIATSTIKYVFRKLVSKGLINYDEGIEVVSDE